MVLECMENLNQHARQKDVLVMGQSVGENEYHLPWNEETQKNKSTYRYFIKGDQRHYKSTKPSKAMFLGQLKFVQVENWKCCIV